MHGHGAFVYTFFTLATHFFVEGEVSFPGIDSFQTIMDTIQLHYNEILNYYNHRSTNASAEQLNSKIKAFRKSLRGVHDLCFFFFRLTKIYA